MYGALLIEKTLCAGNAFLVTIFCILGNLPGSLRILKKITKACLLSGLVYPGVGHFHLNHPLRGGIFVCLTSVSLVALMGVMIVVIQPIADDIAAGRLSIPANELTAYVKDSLYAEYPKAYFFSIAGIVGCWLLALLDLLRLHYFYPDD